MKSPRHKKIEKADKELWKHNLGKRVYPTDYIEEDAEAIIELAKKLNRMAELDRVYYRESLKKVCNDIRDHLGRSCVIALYTATRIDTNKEVALIQFFETVKSTNDKYYKAYFDEARNLPYIILGRKEQLNVLRRKRTNHTRLDHPADDVSKHGSRRLLSNLP